MLNAAFLKQHSWQPTRRTRPALGRKAGTTTREAEGNPGNAGRADQMFSYYLKKSFVDHEPGIDLVNIHYTWTPLGQLPNWEAHRETRAMPRGGVFFRGLGGTTVDDSGHYTETSVETIQLPDDGVRRKVIRLPNEIQDPTSGKYTDHYALHHYFEILRGSKQEAESAFH
jgi:hypothetical protein